MKEKAEALRNQNQMEKNLEKWNRGEYVYSEAEEALMKLEGGERIGKILVNCTICPVGNATCSEYFTITTAGFHPEKRMEKHEIMICSAEVQKVDDCPLNK